MRSGIVQIIRLTLENYDITTITSDAFNVEAFKMMEFLAFKSMPVRILQQGIFNGLDNLRFVEFHSMPVYQVEPNIFSRLNRLRAIDFNDCTVYSIRMDYALNITSDMEHFRIINGNLKSTINEKTFNGLRSFRKLFLSYNRIKTIRKGTFDSDLYNIIEIDLEGNHLKKLPEYIFDRLLFTSKPIINLNNNPWHCDCFLNNLKNRITNFSDLFGIALKCKTPVEFSNRPLIKADFCKTPLTLNTHTWYRCSVPSYDILFKFKDNDRIQIKKLPNGHPVVTLEWWGSGLFLIWFDSTATTNSTKCLFTTRLFRSSEVLLEWQFKREKYTVCAMKKMSSTVHPLSCASFVAPKQVNQTDEMWISQNHRTVAAILISIVYVIAIFFGLGLSDCLMKIRPTLVYSPKTTVASALDRTLSQAR